MVGRRALLVFASAMTFVAVACGSPFGSHDGPPLAPSDDAAEASDAGGESASEVGPIDAEAGACDPAATVVNSGLVACSSDQTFKKDLSTDPMNCGRCGHDCLGGGCAGGLCQPTTIFTDTLVDGGRPNFGASVIGVAGGYVYWGYPADLVASADVIRRGHVDGGGTVEELGQTAKAMVSAAVDDNGLYYAHDTEVFELAPGGLPRLIGTLTSPMVPSGAMALGPDRLYVADGQTTVSSFARSGGVAAVIRKNASAPTWLVVDGTWTAWLEAPWESNGSNAAASLVGTHQSSQFVVPVGQATALTTHGGAFYWFDVSAHRINRLTESAGATIEEVATVAITPARRAHGLVVDGSRAFLGAESDTLESMVVFELSLCGGPTTMRTASLLNVYSPIVGDDTALYWGTYDQGIVRMAK